MIRSSEFKPYFSNNDDPRIVARVFQEERVTGETSLRVVHAQEYLKERIEKDNWVFNRHAEVERKATVNVFELMKDGYGMVIWVSPKSDIYEEGRLNILLKTREGEREGFNPWAIPLLLNEEESLDLGERLLGLGGVSMDVVKDVESLREEPIGFKLENLEEWVEKCKELMPEYGKEWDFIKKGGVEENMEVIVGQIEEARKVARGSNVVFELEMLKRGYKLNVSGSHGGSWLSQMGRGVGLFEVFDGVKRLGRGDERLAYCESCGCYYMKKKGSCPLCGKKKRKE